MSDVSPVFLGFVASLITGLATGVGALPVLFTKNISQKTQDIMLGFGAGIMLAATSFCLVAPGVESAYSYTQSKSYSAIIVIGGILIGAVFLYLAGKYFPHEHFIKGPEGANLKNLRRIWLFIIAITLHNLPEGLSVGVGFGSGEVSNGVSLAIGIGLQNMPEGLVVALALITERYSPLRAVGIALLTGMVEPVCGFIGAFIVSFAKIILPIGMGFAAGAMLFVISDEIIPESHRKGFEKEATLGFIIGFVIMTFLDVVLG